VPYFLALDPAGGIYVTGSAGPAPPGSPSVSDLQMTTIKYAPSGARRWVLFNNTGRGVSVRIGTDRAIYLQGFGGMLTARYLDTAPQGAISSRSGVDRAASRQDRSTQLPRG
jgi:hypothetical protein